MRVLIFILIIAGLILGLIWWLSQPLGADNGQEFILITIASPKQMAEELRANDLIRSPALFRLIQASYGRTDVFLAGQYQLSPALTYREIIEILEAPTAILLDLPPELNKQIVSQVIADALAWEEAEAKLLPQTWSAIQWQNYHRVVADNLADRFDWTKEQQEKFLSLSGFYYYQSDWDLFSQAYVPGTYLLSPAASRAQVADILVSRLAQKSNNHLAIIDYLNLAAAEEIHNFLTGDNIMAPDLVPQPPTDLEVTMENDQIWLKFTTEYWNIGQGPLELIMLEPAITETRPVHQRLYRTSGNHQDELIGDFDWFENHKHYHLTDFMLYQLKPIKVEGNQPAAEENKITFCLRDMEIIDAAWPGLTKEPEFDTCLADRQGVSVGWADIYYQTFDGQSFNITDWPAGIYQLVITVNPDRQITELDYNNNTSAVTIELNPAQAKVRVLDQYWAQ